MTNPEALLRMLERDFRPESETFPVDMKPRDIERMRQLAAKWDTHPINVLSRALQLAEELADASRRGAEITVRRPLRWRRVLRQRRGYTIKAARKGPEN